VQGQGYFPLTAMIQLALILMAILYIYERVPGWVKQLITDVIAVARDVGKDKRRPEDPRCEELPEADSTASKELEEDLRVKRHDLNLMRQSQAQAETATRQAIDEERELQKNMMDMSQAYEDLMAAKREDREQLEVELDMLRCECADLKSVIGLLKSQYGALKAEFNTRGGTTEQSGPGISKLCYVETNNTLHIPGCTSMNCAVNPIHELRPCMKCVGLKGKHIVATPKEKASASNKPYHKTRFVIAC
jgi:hypothetical protein